MTAPLYVRVALNMVTGHREIVGGGNTWADATNLDHEPGPNDMMITAFADEAQAMCDVAFELGRFEDDQHLPERMIA